MRSELGCLEIWKDILDDADDQDVLLDLCGALAKMTVVSKEKFAI